MRSDNLYHFISGYYEHEIVKSLRTQKKWLLDARDKVVKVVAPHLRDLPANYKYKVIFMNRDIHEIMASQKSMLRKLGKVSPDVNSSELMKQLENSRSKAIQWAKNQEHIEVLEVDYVEVLTNPFEQAIRITGFLNKKIQPEKIIQAIEPSLYREKVSISSLTKTI